MKITNKLQYVLLITLSICSSKIIQTMHEELLDPSDQLQKNIASRNRDEAKRNAKNYEDQIAKIDSKRSKNISFNDFKSGKVNFLDYVNHKYNKIKRAVGLDDFTQEKKNLQAKVTEQTTEAQTYTNQITRIESLARDKAAAKAKDLADKQAKNNPTAKPAAVTPEPAPTAKPATLEPSAKPLAEPTPKSVIPTFFKEEELNHKTIPELNDIKDELHKYIELLSKHLDNNKLTLNNLQKYKITLQAEKCREYNNLIDKTIKSKSKSLEPVKAPTPAPKPTTLEPSAKPTDTTSEPAPKPDITNKTLSLEQFREMTDFNRSKIDVKTLSNKTIADALMHDVTILNRIQTEIAEERAKNPSNNASNPKVVSLKITFANRSLLLDSKQISSLTKEQVNDPEVLKALTELIKIKEGDSAKITDELKSLTPKVENIKVIQDWLDIVDSKDPNRIGSRTKRIMDSLTENQKAELKANTPQTEAFNKLEIAPEANITSYYSKEYFKDVSKHFRSLSKEEKSTLVNSDKFLEMVTNSLEKFTPDAGLSDNLEEIASLVRPDKASSVDNWLSILTKDTTSHGTRINAILTNVSPEVIRRLDSKTLSSAYNKLTDDHLKEMDLARWDLIMNKLA
jgi:hypothetical protein